MKPHTSFPGRAELMRRGRDVGPIYSERRDAHRRHCGTAPPGATGSRSLTSAEAASSSGYLSGDGFYTTLYPAPPATRATLPTFIEPARSQRVSSAPPAFICCRWGRSHNRFTGAHDTALATEPCAPAYKTIRPTQRSPRSPGCRIVGRLGPRESPCR